VDSVQVVSFRLPIFQGNLHLEVPVLFPSRFMPKTLKSLFLPLAAGFAACLALAGPASAQGAGSAPGVQGPPGFSQLLVPATPFKWSTTSHLGPVQIPIPGQYGWFLLKGLNLEARAVPSLTGDPTVEVLFAPPASGHPTKAERITFQFPLDPASIPGSGALVIAFHSYSVSEKDIWINTQLAQICKERGWLLVAPYGMVDTHYGNFESQLSLDNVLSTVGKFFHWDPQRVYTVGFSMGGGAALSYSMRHLQSGRTQIAGVVNHTGTQDLVDVYNKGNIAVKQMLINDSHFHGPPTTEDGAYAYKRVSPSIFTGGALDPDFTPVRNLAHLPIYTFVNLDDPQTNLVADNLAVSSYLQGQGVNVNLATAHKGAIHAWSTLDLDAALNWISGYSLPADPLAATVFADLQGQYFGTNVRQKPLQRIAYYEFSADSPTNSFHVDNTRDLDSLVLDLPALGLNPALALGGSWSSQETIGDELVLSGYTTAPTQVLMNGMPSTTWTFEPILGEVVIPIPAGPTSGLLLIMP